MRGFSEEIIFCKDKRTMGEVMKRLFYLYIGEGPPDGTERAVGLACSMNFFIKNR
jgi:hypothetical protein